MTVLVVFDTKTQDVRRYDSSHANPVTHEAEIPEDYLGDIGDVLRAIRATPSGTLQTDAYKAYLDGRDNRPGPWKPRSD